MNVEIPVEIEETLKCTVIVKVAADLSEKERKRVAFELAKQLYQKEEVVLTADNSFVETSMSIDGQSFHLEDL